MKCSDPNCPCIEHTHCQCKEDWSDGTAYCDNCGKKIDSSKEIDENGFYKGE